MLGIELSIDEKARELIKTKGNLLTISHVSIKNCCVPINEVNIQYEKPDNPKMFHEMKLENIFLYIDKRLHLKEHSIHIKHSGIGPFQKILVEGISYLS